MEIDGFQLTSLEYKHVEDIYVIIGKLKYQHIFYV